ncbi:twin-arginine translocase TatA/TatE family subunit [Gemmata sp. JC673]|uniref:Twin-arginine translocase TatA/TatE family subunit n=1 Tax=Gemmata algarum TaxID=2975278 RepID=A0ABU5EXN6_9BACT|nr:twin-arginine translocase TatA/TatE family subunit [Gemmata algarum]MDY3558583.1 twin-arginine translocase TatA/TatE family subunit [Gemmata algarum]
MPVSMFAFLPGIGPQELLLLALLGVLLFGRRLPELGRSLGKTVVEVKKGLRGIEDEVSEPSSSRQSAEPESIKAPQRVTASTTPRFDDVPASPSVPPKV